MTPREVAARAEALRPAMYPHVRTTPLRLLGVPDGPHAFVKCEHLQATGSFKARGALSKLLTLGDHERSAGVVAASTGNHGAAVAYAAGRLGSHASVFVPESTPSAKLTNIRRWGASIERVPGDPIQAELRAREDAAARGVAYISPYNDADVVIGQATVGVELVRQLPDVDTVIVSVGGGGLISGIGSVLRSHRSGITLIGASAANSGIMMESIAAGHIVDRPSLPTLSDGTAGGLEPDTITFDWCRLLVDEWVSVPETLIETALVTALTDYPHDIIEGAAGLAMAAWRRVSVERDLGVCAVISCGGNIDGQTIEALTAARVTP